MKRKILIAEDDDLVFAALKQEFEMRGMVVFHVNFASLASSLVGIQKFDGIVLDLALLDGSGLDVLKEISRNPHLKGVPIVIHSGRAGEYNFTAEMSARCTAVIAKAPNSLNRVITAVQTAIQ